MNQDEKVRLGYQTAMGLIASDGQVIWLAFTALVAANTGLAVIVGAGIKFFPTFLSAGRFLSGVGIIVCLAWILILIRQFRYFAYWFTWARHYEKEFLYPEVQITTIGKTYGEGSTREQKSNVPKFRRFSILGRVTVESLMIIVALAYLLVHGAILYASASILGSTAP